MDDIEFVRLKIRRCASEPFIDGAVDETGNQVLVDLQDVVSRRREIVSIGLLVGLGCFWVQE